MHHPRHSLCATDDRSNARVGHARRPAQRRGASLTFLAPLALVALLVPAAILLVHWFFGSRRRLRVSAVFLWTDLPRASTGRSRRRWPPLTLLLLLQLLAAVLAVLALARPATRSQPPRHVALVLDVSGSM